MAKPRAWMEGVNHERDVEAKEVEFRKLLVDAFEYIRQNQNDCPWMVKNPQLEAKIFTLLENPHIVKSLAEQWHFQNIYSLTQSVLEKVGCQSEGVISELYLIFARVQKK